MFDMPFGCYCGLLLEKRLAIRVAKVLARQTQELKELIAANINETEISEWTLAYPDNKQTSIHFYDPKASPRQKLDRLRLMDKVKCIGDKLDNLFEAKSMEEAELYFLESIDKVEFLRNRKL